MRWTPAASSIRAHFERFPATVKGAFVLRGADRDPHQVRDRGRAGRRSCSGAGSQPIERGAGHARRGAEARLLRPVRVPGRWISGRGGTASRATWTSTATTSVVRPGTSGSPWRGREGRCGGARSRRREVDRGGLDECHDRQVECAGDSVRRALRAAGPRRPCASRADGVDPAVARRRLRHGVGPGPGHDLSRC